MIPLLLHPATLIWAILAAVTSLSWWLGADHGLASARPHVLITVGVLVLAFVKVRLIVFHFMEVRGAPWPLRRICDAWIVAVCLAVVCLYRWGTPG